MLALDDGDLCDSVRRIGVDPAVARRYDLDGIIRRNFEALATTAAARPPLQFAYSIKTNPDPAFAGEALRANLFAEVISPQELAFALSLGFGNRTIYNGPWPAWQAGAAPGIAFADSVAAFAENAHRLPDTVCGFRVRPEGISSRFGIAREDVPDAIAAIRASGRRSIALSFHVRPQDYGSRTWREIVDEVVAFGKDLERATRSRIAAFDVGGGPTPAEFDRLVAAGDLTWLISTVTLELPSTEAIYLEPGQAVATPCAVYVAPVLERRSRSVVIAAGYPEVSQIRTFPHRVLGIYDDGTVQLLRDGTDCILGRTCLEYDIVRNDVRLPAQLDSLRAVVIADAGAYDSSMAFGFGLGGNKQRDELGVARR